LSDSCLVSTIIVLYRYVIFVTFEATSSPWIFNDNKNTSQGSIMKNQKKYLWLFLSFFLCLTSLSAQNNVRDVIYLKNGSIIKGSLVEILPGISVKIQTTDGSIYVYTMTEIQKIEKESISTPQPVISSSALPEQGIKEIVKPKISIYGGVAIPMGDFSEEKEMSWKGKTGYTFGIQYASGEEIGFLINGSYTSNSASFGGISSPYGGSGSSNSWASILVLVGLKMGTTNSAGANFTFAPLFGLHVSVSPTINYYLVQPAYEYYGYSTYYYSLNIESVTSTAFAYGAMLEMSVGRTMIGMRYIASRPKYQVSASYSGSYNYYSEGSTSLTQNVSFMQVYLGVAF
jgi:hypothetical protein